MSTPFHQASNQWYSNVQREANLHHPPADKWAAANESMDPTGTHPFHSSFDSGLSLATGSTAPGSLGEGRVYDALRGNVYYDQHSGFHEDLIYNYPEYQEAGLGQVLPNVPDGPNRSERYGITRQAGPIQEEYLGPLSMGNTASPIVGVDTLTHTNSTAEPDTSKSRTRRLHKYHCVQCGDSFDRLSRARDCANKDLGWAPYVCQSRCGKGGCAKAYSSEALLKEHLTERGVLCSQCGKYLSKKNIARHRQEVCY